MWLYSLLVTFYFFVCIFLILLVLIQKGKGSLGLGSIGGGTQMLFGGSGGQDIFQKATWILGALFMLGSFALTIMKNRQIEESRYFGKTKPRMVQTTKVDQKKADY